MYVTVTSLVTKCQVASSPAPVLPHLMGQDNDGNRPPTPHPNHTGGIYLHAKDNTGISLELHPTLPRWAFPWQGLVWGLICVSILILCGAQDLLEGLRAVGAEES